MKRRRKIAVMIAGAAVVAIAAALLANAWFASRPLVPLAGQGNAEPVFAVTGEEGARQAEFTLLTYNVKHCQGGKKIKEIAAEIADTGAQVVFLQEIDNKMTRSALADEAKELAAELDFSYAFFPALKVAGGQYGTAVLSAFPLSGATATTLPAEGGIEPRALGQADIDVLGVPVRLFVTHLSYESEEARAQQFAAIDEALKASPSQSFLMGGDFNVDSYDEYQLLSGAVPAHDANTQGPAINMIDNIFCDASKMLRNVRSVPTGYSDHDLVLAEIFIPID